MADATGNEDQLQFALGMDLTILKTKVAGMVKSGDGKTQVLVLPAKVETASKLSFKDLLEEISKQFGINKDSINTAMDNIKTIFPKFDPEKLTFQLNQIFFYYNKEAAGPTTEYAFSIQINLGGLFELAGVLSIETLYMAIWNTKRVSVLKQLGMADLSTLLPQ